MKNQFEINKIDMLMEILASLEKVIQPKSYEEMRLKHTIKTQLIKAISTV